MNTPIPVQPNQTLLRFAFEEIFNSYDQTKVPDGAYWQGTNTTFEGKVCEGAGRYGDLWQRTGYAGTDVGRGMDWFEFQGTGEWLAVIEYGGNSHLWSFSSTGVPTAITAGSANAQTLATGGQWQFEQVGAYVYLAHKGASTTMYRHKIGDNATAEAFSVFSPTYNRGANFGASVKQPPYGAMTFKDMVLLDPGGLGVTASLVSSAAFRLNFAGATAAGTVYLVFEAQDSWDAKYIDMLNDVWTAGGLLTTPINVSIALTEDNTSAINAAWAATLDYIANGSPINTAGSTWQNTMIITSHLAANRDARKPVKRIVLKLVNGGANFTTGAATYDFVGLNFGGVRLWDVAVPAVGTTVGYAVRWANRKGAVATYTTLVKTPDAIVNNNGAGNDLIGTLPAGATRPYMGTYVQVAVPFDPTRANEGYDWVEWFRQDDTNPANWYKVAEAEHKGAKGDTISAVDTTLQTVVRAGSSVATPGQAGPKADIEVIGTWKQHLILGADQLVFWSSANAPGEFVPAPNELHGAYDTNDPTLGRTEYMQPARRDDLVAVVGVDNCYLGSGRAVGVVIGDRALDATPMRIMFGSHGILGWRAFRGHRGGALAAHYHGLFYYNVSRAFAESTDSPETEPGQELTVSFRAGWKRFRGTSYSGMVLVSHEDQIVGFNTYGGNNRFILFTRPDPDGRRRWQEGTFPQVVEAVSALGQGLRIMLLDGRIGRFGEDATGAKYTTDNGAAVNWSLESGKMFGERSRIVAVGVVGDGAPSVRFDIEDGANTVAIAPVTLTRQAGQFWYQFVTVPPGTVLKVTLSGVVGTDSVKELVMVAEPMGAGYGT